MLGMHKVLGSIPCTVNKRGGVREPFKGTQTGRESGTAVHTSKECQKFLQFETSLSYRVRAYLMLPSRGWSGE